MAKAAKRPRTGPTFVQRSRNVSPGAKARWHHEGSAHVPSRPFFGLTDAEAERIGALLGVKIQARLTSGSSR